MADKVDMVLDGWGSALEGMGETVRDLGETVGAARGQLAHASHFSGELMDGVARLKAQIFRLAEILERPGTRRLIAAGVILFFAGSNLLRAILPSPHGKKRLFL